jgi:hypothetical protein
MPEFEQAAIEDEESAAMRAQHLLEDDNPAIIDAHKTFVATLVCAAAFIGVVTSFIL